MKILRLNGDDDKLYQLVARLVMDKDVLASNNNYPFKTSSEYQWFVACDNDSVIAFMPVCIKNNKATIDNYYVREDNLDILSQIVRCAVDNLANKNILISIAHARHLKIFQDLGFSIMCKWAKYVKLIYNSNV